MKTRIDYEVHCFDRYLSIRVDESDREQAQKLLDRFYHQWHLLEDNDICCEEYMLEELQKAGIEYSKIPNLHCLDYQSLFLMGNKVNIIFGDGSEKLAESAEEIANLDGLAMFEVVEY